MALSVKENTFGMTIDQAKGLRRGQILNHAYAKKDSDGSLARFRVTSVMKWKTRPNNVIIHVKRGLKEFHQFTEFDLEDLAIQP